MKLGHVYFLNFLTNEIVIVYTQQLKTCIKVGHG